MGFTKLDQGMIFSSIASENDAAFKVFTLILAGCKSNGISPLSPVFLSNITKKPIEEIEKCLKILEAPDPYSRSTNDEGRRIRRVDGGFYVINYKKYRDFTYSDNQEAVRKRNYRKKRDNMGHVPPPMGHSASASSSESTSKREKEFIPPTLEEVKEYFKKNGYNGNLANQFFNGYNEGGWKDSRGNNILNWKQKAQQVWFRGNEPNILQPDEQPPLAPPADEYEAFCRSTSAPSQLIFNRLWDTWKSFSKKDFENFKYMPKEIDPKFVEYMKEIFWISKRTPPKNNVAAFIKEVKAYLTKVGK